MTDFLIIVLAGFLAGAVNAVAGGGTFITFPALVFLGVPTIAANASATLAALPGYIGSAWAFRHDMRREGSLSFAAILGVSVLGGLIGAAMLIFTSDRAFTGIVPWLLLVSTLLFAVGPALTRRLKAMGIPAAGAGVSALVLGAVSIYGGYFNGGLGIMLLATFGLLGHSDLHGMNGLKNVLSAVLSLTSAVAFMAAGLIAWQAAAPMAIAATLGGYAGARLSRRISNLVYLRVFVVLVGLAMTVLFFLR
jgi:hypothetical protein